MQQTPIKSRIVPLYPSFLCDKLFNGPLKSFYLSSLFKYPAFWLKFHIFPAKFILDNFALFNSVLANTE